jgi:hypothetical protein
MKEYDTNIGNNLSENKSKQIPPDLPDFIKKALERCDTVMMTINELYIINNDISDQVIMVQPFYSKLLSFPDHVVVIWH